MRLAIAAALAALGRSITGGETAVSVGAGGFCGIETAVCCAGAQETGGRAGTDIAFSGLFVLLVHSCCDIVISEELEQNVDRTLFITSSGDAVGESAGTASWFPKLIASKRIGIAYPFLSSG